MQTHAVFFRFGILLMLSIFSTMASGQTIHTCTVIPAAEQPAVQEYGNLPGVVQKAVSYKPGQTYGNSWVSGSTITVKFFDGSAALRNRVMQYAAEWTRYGNLKFEVVRSGPADIRISFTQNGSSWSMVGNSSARADQQKPSMNFGWLTDLTPDYEVKRTVLHEFGHALGLLHEHQNPAGGIPWDEAAVYSHYLNTQGWDRNTTYNNVIATANRNVTQYSEPDPASIMHYPVDARLTNGRYEVGMNNNLSTIDKQYIAKLYPGRRVVESTSTSSPAPVVTPVVARSHSLLISNELGEGQKAETIRLEIADQEFVIRLHKNGRNRQDLELELPPGKYAYRVISSSTYYGYRNVRDQRGNVRRQYVEQEVPGSGSGYITVDGDAELAMYGSYNSDTGRMRVYLGTGK
ncbi:hypothetical protein FUA23_09415 [Neolewinella aurantiaca]|uniref:Peptidase metallopeptidase domain-containing protein n=1 Tax=Neolewinella aurantiaca TaxID=2602767 RepID=A0A5C7FPL1_9BACT|nr:matrixin family metalloprotease [Neolewinella aurantiaca]TXF89658.1 hypothetical protein FUA23_09415 [Neolewinella aurantiaca]